MAKNKIPACVGSHSCGLAVAANFLKLTGNRVLIEPTPSVLNYVLQQDVLSGSLGKKRSDFLSFHVPTKQRPDILAFSQDNKLAVWEIQVSSISPEVFNTRNLRYLKLGLSVNWILSASVGSSTINYIASNFNKEECHLFAFVRHPLLNTPILEMDNFNPDNFSVVTFPA